MDIAKHGNFRAFQFFAPPRKTRNKPRFSVGFTGIAPERQSALRLAECCGMNALLPLAVWVPILDGDEIAAQIYLDHYASERSRARRIERDTKLIMGPGQKLLLATPCRRALFGWRVFIDDTGQTGVNCAVFSNRGAGLASDLIRAADAIADRRWPGMRHYTYVDPRRVRGNPPGNCFRRAGWRECGKTKSRGLLILERAVSRLTPEAAALPMTKGKFRHG